MAARRMTASRLQAIYRRQDPPAWGAEYQPSILATREEAPAISRAAQLWSVRLNRYVHALSATEQAAVRLALFHRGVFELQEQRMLPVDRKPHPLTGHGRTVGLNLPDLPGTIAVAERLDLLKLHSLMRPVDRQTGERQHVPIPFIGDLLLFVADEAGPYCVNWTVKLADKDFQQSINPRQNVKNPEKAAHAARGRHAIEEQLYLDAGIRTVRVIGSTIPTTLDHNLRNLFLHHLRMNQLGEAIDQELEDRIRATLSTGEAPQSVLLSVTHRHGCDYQDVRNAFFWLLWEQRVRVELIEETVLVDRPLRPERNDVGARFAHLFNRRG